MLLFCPCCSNTLTVSTSSADFKNRLECQTCPYTYIMHVSIYERKHFKLKEVAAQLGGEDEFKNADKITQQCQKDGCDGMQAIYYSVQIRSADEPATNFYKCTTCMGRWRE